MLRHTILFLLLAFVSVAPCWSQDDAAVHFKAGLDAWNAGKVDVAIYEWQSTLRLKPDSPTTKDRLLQALVKKVEQLEAELKSLRVSTGSATSPVGQPEPPRSSDSVKPGTVKGTITYYRSRASHVPDVGTQIFLLEGSDFSMNPGSDIMKRDGELWVISKDANDKIRERARNFVESGRTMDANTLAESIRYTDNLVREDKASVKHRIVRETICDGSGNYEIRNVPPDPYTLLILTSSDSFQTKYWKAIGVEPGGVVDVSSLVQLHSSRS